MTRWISFLALWLICAGPVAAQSSADSLSVLDQLGETLAGGGSGDQFLDPEVAFVMDADALNGDTIVAQWRIHDGYYLYRDKFEFVLKDGTGAQLGVPEIPPGTVKHDEYFGEMEVFYNFAEATIPVQRTASIDTPIMLDVWYQGCADAGLCYPPITKTVALTLPGVVADGGGSAMNVVAGLAAGSRAGVALSEQDRLARSILEDNAWTVMLAFFGFGLLLSFTPCVFPMIPILSSIIVGQRESLTTRKSFMLSMVYVLAMAATYTVAGVIAGFSGQNIQAVFQNPWILSAFSAVFVLLALSMFGLYELQLPRRWQTKLTELSNRQQGGTYVGVGVMGFLSALIVGPCVAAPLAGALVYIGQTGDGLLGGAALFALSMGMGAPLLAIGASAGKLLPRAGAWMDTVKAVFGFLLLAVAIYLLERILPGWVAMLLWAALMIVAAIFMGALDVLQAPASAWQRLCKGSGLVMMVYGVLLMVGAAGGQGDVFQPLRGFGFGAVAESSAELEFKRVKGIEGLEAELVLAAAQGRPVVLEYYADWCVSCKEMEKYTFADPGVRELLTKAVLLQTDVTANDDKDQAMLQRFGLIGPPAILFFDTKGIEQPQFRVVGYMNAEEFRAHAGRAII